MNELFGGNCLFSSDFLRMFRVFSFIGGFVVYVDFLAFLRQVCLFANFWGIFVKKTSGLRITGLLLYVAFCFFGGRDCLKIPLALLSVTINDRVRRCGQTIADL